jgi:hypothetical protein
MCNKVHKLTSEPHLVSVYYHHIKRDNELVDLFPKQLNKIKHTISVN